MTILDLQRGIAEAGRIRIGEQVPTSGGRTRPEKLGTFRFTSADRRAIDEIAGLLGGTVTPWQAPAGPQFQVITEATAVDVIVPPTAMAFTQSYEVWSAGGCLRRCDGITESIGQQPCVCDPDKRECKIHTRLSVMLRDVRGLGLWRIDTQGWYAARELAGAVEVLALAAGRGTMIPARLLLEQRSVKRPGKDGKPQTMRFAVPRLDLGITPGDLLLGGGAPAITMAAITDGAPPERRLTPVPQIEGPRPSIAEQSAPPPERPPRRNAAPEIPASGRRRAAPVERYWQARAFAEASERGLSTDTVREIAAGVCGVPLEGFSMSTLTEPQWEQVHRLIPGFAAPAQDSPDAEEAEFVDADAAPEQSAPAEPPRMTADEFKAFLERERIASEYARAVSERLFPGLTKLDGAQRARLAAALAA